MFVLGTNGHFCFNGKRHVNSVGDCFDISKTCHKLTKERGGMTFSTQCYVDLLYLLPIKLLW